MDVKKQLFTDAETNTVSSSGNNDEDNYEDAGWEEVIVSRRMDSGSEWTGATPDPEDPAGAATDGSTT